MLAVQAEDSLRPDIRICREEKKEMIIKDDISKDGGGEDITSSRMSNLGHGSELGPAPMITMSFTNAYRDQDPSSYLPTLPYSLVHRKSSGPL